MAAILSPAPIVTSGVAGNLLARVLQLTAALRRAGDQTRADLARAEAARGRSLERDTAQARAMANRYARSAPSFAADIRAAIDRHEFLQSTGG